MEGHSVPDEAISMVRRVVCDVILRALEGYAAQMERGEVPLRSGPDALRDFHLALEATVESFEDCGQ